jgi:hypothetical protein
MGTTRSGKNQNGSSRVVRCSLLLLDSLIIPFLPLHSLVTIIHPTSRPSYLRCDVILCTCTLQVLLDAFFRT